jgi:hypothetical protein
MVLRAIAVALTITQRFIAASYPVRADAAGDRYRLHAPLMMKNG